jgi:hypothetical protein
MIRPEDRERSAPSESEPPRGLADAEPDAELEFQASAPEHDPEFVQRTREVSQGLGWLGWTAGLSVLNVFFAVGGAQMSFALALAFSLLPAMLFHQIAVDSQAPALNAVGVVLGLVPAAILLGLIWLARRGRTWAILVALVMVLADTAVFALFEDWLSVLLHGACLWFAFRAWRAHAALAAS